VQGKHRTARVDYEKILDSYRINQVGETTELAETYFGFGTLLSLGDDEDKDEALTLLEQALSTYRRIYGTGHISIAVAAYTLAVCLLEQNHHQEAAPLFNEALTLFRLLNAKRSAAQRRAYQSMKSLEYDDEEDDEEGGGDGHAVKEPAVIGEILLALGSIQHAEKRFEASKAYYSEALLVFTKLYGNTHPTVAKALNNLATLMDDSGSLSEARELYEYALSALRQYYGDVHPLVLVTMENLAAVLDASEDREAAEDLREQVVFAFAICIDSEANGYMYMYMYMFTPEIIGG
jgi:tetratricopeptide (TPR) repeat protein